MSYLITHTLLSSWLYAMKENPFVDDTDKEPFADFLTTLRREPHEQNEAMQNGLRFETEIENIANGNVPEKPEFSTSTEIAEAVAGGIFQYSANKPITVRGMELVLHGRLDVLKAGIIYDFKFSKSYERGKYFDSTQHPCYFALIPEARAFTYIVSNGTDVWTETYERDETPDICPVISDFLEWLEAVGFMDIYKKYWTAK